MKKTREDVKRERTTRRQRQILDAALDVFSRRGFGEATTAEIARSAGIAEGTIYNYYRSKRDLVVALIRDSIDTDRLARAIDEAPDGAGEMLLGRLIEDRLDMGLGNADRLLVLTSEVHHDASLREQYVEEVARPILSRLEDYLKSGVRRGTFRDLDAGLVARALWGMVMGLSIIHVLEGKSGPLRKMPRDRMAKELTEVMMDGLRRKSTPGHASGAKGV